MPKSPPSNPSSALPPLTQQDKAKFFKLFIGCGPVSGLLSGELTTALPIASGPQTIVYSRRKGPRCVSQIQTSERKIVTYMVYPFHSRHSIDLRIFVFVVGHSRTPRLAEVSTAQISQLECILFKHPCRQLPSLSLLLSQAGYMTRLCSMRTDMQRL